MYQAAYRTNSFRMRSRRRGTRICLVHSAFIDRMKRSMTAMLPCSPTAPNRGRIPHLLHHRLKAVKTDDVPGLGAGLLDGPAKERADLGRCRPSIEDGEANDESGGMIQGDSPPPAERPASGVETD